LIGAWFTFAFMLFTPGSFESFLFASTDYVTSRVGLAVAASWSWLAWNGRWRSEPTWTDRLGRAIGVIWIVSAALVGVFAAAAR
jgi:hypothetical protein